LNIGLKKLSKMLIAFSLVFVLIVFISGTFIQSVNAIKKEVKAGNLLKIGTIDSSICNNSFCYKYASQEEVKKLPTIQSKSPQMINNTDAQKRIISAINQAQAQKRAYEQSHIGEQNGPWKVMAGTLHSVTEVHTELSPTNPPKHEIAMILPDIGKIYEGVMAYSASTDVAPATLVVPVNSSEMKGQLAAAMDGKKLYAITTEDHEQKIGTWQFAGNVLTIHNIKPIPFNVNYTVIYRELESSKNNKIGTIQSIPSTLLRNNSEQLAVIIPPTTANQYSGKLSYTASQNVQLVVFHGPLGSGEGKEQRIWSPDNGKTRYALTYIDPGNNMGNLIFAGNGLVIRSSSDKPFAVSYAVVGSGN
jgi:hypothetical protein